MASSTQRNNIKVVGFIIAIMVMIVIGLFRATYTLKILRRLHLATFNSARNNRIRLSFIRIVMLIFAYCLCMHEFAALALPVKLRQLFAMLGSSVFMSIQSSLLFAFFCLGVLFLILFLIGTVSFSLLIWLCAYFTDARITTWTTPVFVKVRKTLHLFAMRACFTCLGKHCLFLNKTYYLLAVSTYSTKQTFVQGELP